MRRDSRESSKARASLSPLAHPKPWPLGIVAARDSGGSFSCNRCVPGSKAASSPTDSGRNLTVSQAWCHPRKMRVQVGMGMRCSGVVSERPRHRSPDSQARGNPSSCSQHTLKAAQLSLNCLPRPPSPRRSLTQSRCVALGTRCPLRCSNRRVLSKSRRLYPRPGDLRSAATPILQPRKSPGANFVLADLPGGGHCEQSRSIRKVQGGSELAQPQT